MHELDVAITHWTNGWAGKNTILDFFMISVATIGVPFIVLIVVANGGFLGAINLRVTLS